MGVDASASSLAPNPVVVEQKKPVSVVEHQQKPSVAVTEIFDRSDYESPQETLTKLAAIDPNESAATDTSIETNIDNSSKTPEASAVTDSQPETPPVDITTLEQEDQQKTAEEIKQVNETIQQESTPKVEAVVETPKTLFPDSPPLYDKYHQAYEKEKKTIKGALTRSRDIKQIQKDYLKGVKKGSREYPSDIKEFKKNVVLLYDTLRSRGVPQKEIVERNSDKSLKINPKIYPSPFYITGIQRLDSLGLMPSDFLSSDKKFTETVKKIRKVAKPSEENFQNSKDQLNQYGFLSGQNIVPFIANNYYNEEVNQALSSLQKDFFSSPENQQKLADYLKLHPNENLFGFVLNKGRDYNDPYVKMLPFMETLIDADINHGEKITISNECIKANDSGDKTWLQYQNLYNRDQQVFLLDKSRTLSNKDFIDRYFNDDYGYRQGELRKQRFYMDYIIQSANLGEETNAGDLFSLITIASHQAPLESDRIFYSNVNNVTALGYYYDIVPQIVSNKDKADLYFKDGKATSYLFKDVIRKFHSDHNNDEEVNRFITRQVPVVLSSFSPEDQIFWTNILKLQDPPLRDIFKSESYLSKEGTLTPQFLRDYLSVENNTFKFFIKENLTSELIQTFPLEEQDFWLNVASLDDLDHSIYNFLVDNQPKLNTFFTKDHNPTSLLFNDYVKSISDNNDYYSFKSNLTPEVLQSFSPEDQKFWGNFMSIYEDAYKKGLNQMNVFFSDESYLTPQGKLTADFFKKNIGNTSPNISYFVQSNLTPEVLQSFSPEDQKILNISLSLMKRFEGQKIKSYIYTNIEAIASSADPEETLTQYISIINQVETSPSKEILRIKDQLLTEIANNPNPLKVYQRIYDIFLKNNLPMVGKIYQVFDVLYPPDKVNEMLSRNNKLSRVLINSKSPRLRQQIIFNDLLKANLGSGEQSLVNYLNLFQTSSPLLEKVRVGGKLTPTESAQVTVFFRKLDTLYDVSLLSRTQPTKIFDTSTIQSKVSELYQKYKVAEGQTIADRVAQMYLSGLGIKSISEAFNYIKQTKETAHQRNLTRTNFSLSTGDLVKSVKSSNLDNILNFGCVAKEYLGSDADSDRTPFDTDFIRSSSTHLASRISSVGAGEYGDLFLIVKDRGQLQNSSEDGNSTYDPNKLEVFYSGAIDKRHYGIRTGFPSSEIDFLVATDTDPQKLAGIYFQIASHDVYIPVINKTGKLLFTPDDYGKYKLDTESINKTISESNFSPTKLINTLKSNPYIKKLYSLDAGVSEGYSVGEHTQMVMGQFEKYFSKEYSSKVLTREEFRLLLSLHDIGKGEAVAETGKTQEQHAYTQKIAKNIFIQSGISEQSSDVMVGLIDQDIIGEYFKGQTFIGDASKSIKELSEKINIPVIELVDTLKTFYICDAGAYTSDAGGTASLDGLFSFNPKKGKVTFSESTEAKYQELINFLSSGDAR